jgi:hypothetical protein
LIYGLPQNAKGQEVITLTGLVLATSVIAQVIATTLHIHQSIRITNVCFFSFAIVGWLIYKLSNAYSILI